MIRTALEILSGVALIAFTYFCISASMALHANSAHVADLLMNLDESVTKLNSTLDTVNKKDGTLAQVNKALTDVRLTVAHSDRLLTKQEQSVNLWNSQVTSTLGNVNESVVALTKNQNKITNSTVETLNATTESVKAVKPLVENLTVEAQDLQTTTTSINAMMPSIQATTQNINVMSQNGKDATKDLKDYIHGILHPSWPKRIWGYSVDLAHAVL